MFAQLWELKTRTKYPTPGLPPVQITFNITPTKAGLTGKQAGAKALQQSEMITFKLIWGHYAQSAQSQRKERKMDHMLRATSCLFLPTVSTGLRTKKETMTRYPKIAIVFIHFAAGSERLNGLWLAFQVISFSAVMHGFINLFTTVNSSHIP